MHRFFSSQPLTEILILRDSSQLHQILNVFRAKKGEKIIFFEAYGDDKIYEIEQVGKKQIELVQKETVARKQLQKNNDITVFQSFPNKIATMEMIVQKMVEIGVRNLVFFPSERSQIHEMPAGKIARLSSIAQEALEQSGDSSPLVIKYLQKNTEITYLEMGTDMEHIVGYPGKNNILQINKTNKKYALWIGPEGGWSEKEVLFFQKQKCFLWTFNQRILRLETASIVGAGILSYSLE